MVFGRGFLTFKVRLLGYQTAQYGVAEQTVHNDMVPHHPSNGKQELGRKDGPDEQVLSQERARDHNSERAECRKERQTTKVREESIGPRTPRRPFAHQQRRRGHPPDRPGPVAEEREDADADDVVAADAVVRIGQVDRGDGVRAAEDEERGVLEQ